MGFRLWSVGLAFALLCSATQAQETPKRGGVFNFGVFLDPSSLDCHSSVGTGTMQRAAPSYSLLIRISETNYPQIEGDLADSWTVSPDGLTYTFKLHPGVLFHDGTVLTSADIKATFDRLRNPPTGVVSIRQQNFADIDSIETPDDLTVVFKLKKPNASMLVLLASPWNCVYSAKRLAEDPKFPATNVMGTGPFKFVRYTQGAEWVGERFDKYFKPGLPYLDGFQVITFAPPAYVQALIAGRTMGEFRGLDPVQRDTIVKARGDTVRAYEQSSPGMFMVSFNTTRKPFDDLRVRRALSLAIDRWKMSDVMHEQSFQRNTGGFARPGSLYARSNEELEKLPGLSRDIEVSRAEAKRLLAEAGVSDLKFTFTNQTIFAPFGVYLVDQWRQIGVTVAHETPDTPRFAAQRTNSNFDAILDAIQDYVDDPTLQLAVFQSRDIARGNVSMATDREFDAMYQKQAATTDFGERKKIVQQMEEHLFTTAYSVPLQWASRIIVLDSALHGFRMTPSALIGRDMATYWLDR